MFLLRTTVFAAFLLMVHGFAAGKGFTFELGSTSHFGDGQGLPAITSIGGFQIRDIESQASAIPAKLIGQKISAEGSLSVTANVGQAASVDVFTGAHTPGINASLTVVSGAQLVGSTLLNGVGEGYCNGPTGTFCLPSQTISVAELSGTVAAPVPAAVARVKVIVSSSVSDGTNPATVDGKVEANGSVTITNKYEAFAISKENAALLEGAGAIIAALAVSAAIGFAGFAILTTGVSAASVLSVAAAIGGVVGLVNNDKLISGATDAVKVANALLSPTKWGSQLPTLFEVVGLPVKLSNVTMGVAMLGGQLTRMANDPPRADFTLSTGLSDIGSDETLSTPGYRTAACMSQATTALERYQGALMAGDYASANARIADYRTLEACFLDSSTIDNSSALLQQYLANLPTVVSNTLLKDVFRDLTLADLGWTEGTAFQEIAVDLGLTQEELLEQVKQLVASADENFDAQNFARDFQEAQSNAFSDWVAVVPAEEQVPIDVSEPQSVALVTLGIAAMLVIRRRSNRLGQLSSVAVA